MSSFFKIIKRKIYENKFIILLTLFYFVIRIINLTKLPVFNDESIYLDWGYREIHNPGFLYYSLYDAKQPLLMWIFGIFEYIFVNPLFGGRLVSVITGFITLLGLYKLSKYLFSKEVGFIGMFVYSIVPIFSFFDRQALMESAIASVGIWSGYLFLKNVNVYKNKNAIILGIVLGIGFFIKSTSLLFLFSYLFINFLLIIFAKNKAKNGKSVILVIISFSLTIFFLLINPVFWQTFQTNSRYSMTIPEILSFPLGVWVSNLFANFSISFIFITPLLFLTALAGIIKMVSEKSFTKNIFLLFFIIPFFANTILIRVPSDRYLVSFLLFLIIVSSYLLFVLIKKNKIYISIFFIVLLPAFLLTVFQIINPFGYIQFMDNITPLNDSVYIKGQTSGYGINDVISYFDNIAVNKKIIIGTGENTGNPESAMFVFFNKNKNITVTYFDYRLLGPSVENYDCISVGFPTYFVSRDNQLVGIDKFLQKEKTISKPFDKSTIGIYKLKDNCKGKVANLHLKRDQ